MAATDIREKEMTAKTSSQPSKEREANGIPAESIPGDYVEHEDGDTDSATLLHEPSESAAQLSPQGAPPLPSEPPPGEIQDDGWDPVWDPTAQAYYFYNRFTQASQWTNPRVPDHQQPSAPGVGNYDRISAAPGTTTTPSAPGTSPHPQPPTQPQAQERPYGGYDPAIHGDYDPTASYAQQPAAPSNGPSPLPADEGYSATGAFNRFTGKWQAADITPELHNDENKSKRQMNAFFDVDAAANSHNGKSLKAERSGKKLSKQELKAFKEKRKEKKEERRRAWLRD